MNIINDNWLKVKYLNGDIVTISLKQAFIDAKNIEDIITIKSHGYNIYIYDFSVIQLFVSILLAAYFKPENNFRAGDPYFNNKLVQDGWDLSLILDYLDRWQDRFNLFDDKHPFMQDIELKSLMPKETDKLQKNIPRLNIVAPQNNKLIFENISGEIPENILDTYDLTESELVYALLNSRLMGASPMPKIYPNKSLLANITLFVVNKGNNLYETIIYNSVPLVGASRDKEAYDRPCWELESDQDILKYDMSKMAKNRLLCTFFPAKPIYVNYDNGIQNVLLYKADDNKCILDKETINALRESFILNNPYILKVTKIETNKNKEEKIIIYPKQWSNSIKLNNLCIEATGLLPNGYRSCEIINNIEENNAKVVIYFREYDQNKMCILLFGKHELPHKYLDKLKPEKYHEKAIKFQDIFETISNIYSAYYKADIPKSDVQQSKLKYSKFAENFFFEDLINNIDDDDIILKFTDESVKFVKNELKSLGLKTKNVLQYANIYRKSIGRLNKIKEKNNAGIQTDE